MYWEALLSQKIRRRLTLAFWILVAALALKVLAAGPLEIGARTKLLPLLAAALLVRTIFDRRERHERLEKWVRKHLDAYRKTAAGELALSVGDPTIAIAGKIRREEALIAPVTGRSCAAWRLEAQLLRRRDFAFRVLLPGARLAPLLVTSDVSAVTVDAGDGATLEIGAEAELLLSEGREVLLSWVDFCRLPFAAKKLIDDALAKQSLEHKDWAGIRVEEGIIEAGEFVTAFGVCRKTATGIALRALHDPPRPLVLTTWSAREVERSGKNRKRALVRGAARVAAAAIVLLFLWARADFRKVGTIGYVPGRQTWSLDLEPRGHEGTVYNWSLNANQEHSRIQLVADSQDAYVTGRTKVAITRVNTQDEGKSVLGRDARVAWTGERWFLELPPKAAVAAPETQPVRRGSIYVRNGSTKFVKVDFIPEHPEAHSPPTNWEWRFIPGETGDEAIGVHLTQKGEPLDIATGDAVTLRTSSVKGGEYAFSRRFWAGVSSEIVWNGSGWVIAIDDALLSPSREAFLSVKNTTGDAYDLEVTDDEGKHVGRWAFDANEGANRDWGLLLSDKDSIPMRPGFQVAIARVTRERLWSGLLSECPYASFDRDALRWTFLVDGSTP